MASYYRAHVNDAVIPTYSSHTFYVRDNYVWPYWAHNTVTVFATDERYVGHDNARRPYTVWQRQVAGLCVPIDVVLASLH